jgi:AraC family transcriptional regulator
MKNLEVIHPSKIRHREWVKFRQMIHTGKLIVEHQIQPPGECGASGGLTHHLLAFQLSNGTRQVTRISDREYDGTLLKKELILIPAEVPFFAAGETVDESLIFTIDPLFLRQIALETNCTNGDRLELLGILKTQDPQIEAIALSIYSEMQQANWGSKLYLESLANVLAIHLLRNYSANSFREKKYKKGLPDRKLQQVLEYINTYLDRDLELSKLAQVAGMSQYYFASLFKQSMSVAPWQYVMQQRLDRAKELLTQRDRSIVEIALQCGFKSQSHFTQQFRKFTGITPKRYRDER